MKKIVKWELSDIPNSPHTYGICFLFLYNDFTWGYSSFYLAGFLTYINYDEICDEICHEICDMKLIKRIEFDNEEPFRKAIQNFIDRHVQSYSVFDLEHPTKIVQL